MGAVTSEELDAVFGEDSIGATAAERAKASTRRFVRSQVQIAFASDRATGRVLSAFEALQTFGWDILLQVASEGSARLIRSAQEPAATLKGQREQLGLSLAEVAKRIGASEADVAKAETPGSLSSIRVLETLGAALALDERRLGHLPNAGRDNALGVRLRELRQADATSFGPGTVLSLSEAAWVISRQDYLSKALGFRSKRRVALPPKDSFFNAPPFKLGRVNTN
jgi:transcriptional regulator with XRE-family HTH domain